jgi:hypothetical protein
MVRVKHLSKAKNNGPGSSVAIVSLGGPDTPGEPRLARSSPGSRELRATTFTRQNGTGNVNSPFAQISQVENAFLKS